MSAMYFQVLKINVITFIPSLLACLIATFCVTRSEPQTPPSQSAAQPQMPFFSGLFAVLTSAQIC